VDHGGQAACESSECPQLQTKDQRRGGRVSKWSQSGRVGIVYRGSHARTSGARCVDVEQIDNLSKSPYAKAMQKVVYFFALICLFGCGSSTSDSAADKPKNGSHFESAVPLANGDAYMITEETVAGESSTVLWFVSGTRKVRVDVSVSFPEFVPLADGSAIMSDWGKVWKLNGESATAITEDGQARTVSASSAGFWFVEWHRALLDREGVTDADYDEVIEGLAADAEADYDRPVRDF